MKITHISVSRKGVFEECPQKYKYQYHLKLEPEGPEPFYFTYGTIVHKIAEDYVNAGGEEPIGQIAEAIITGNRPFDQDKEGNELFCPRLPLEYQKKLPNHVTAVQKLVDQMGTDGWAEYRFKLDLDPPNGKHIVGVLDRLIHRGDLWFIIDYKTTKKGRYQKTSRDITDDLQLRTYAWVIQQKFQVPAENIRAALYYVDGTSLVGARFSEESLQRAGQELLEAYNKIVSMPPEQSYGKTGWWCNRCDYRKICPFHSITGQGIR